MLTEFSLTDWLLFVSLCSLLIAFSGFIVFIIRECVKEEEFSLMTVVHYLLGFSYFSALIAFGLQFFQEKQIF